MLERFSAKEQQAPVAFYADYRRQWVDTGTPPNTVAFDRVSTVVLSVVEILARQ